MTDKPNVTTFKGYRKQEKMPVEYTVENEEMRAFKRFLDHDMERDLASPTAALFIKEKKREGKSYDAAVAALLGEVKPMEKE